MNLDITKILRILPHRAPFLLIDRVTDLEPRSSARAIKCVSFNEPHFQGHFPGTPIFPSVLLIEAMAQLMCVLVYASDAIDPATQSFVLVGVEHARFRHPITPGDTVTLETNVQQQRNNIWKCVCTATVGQALCAEAELLAAVQDRD
ncbi:MAG: 3-hydroxyacyl-ACP dehydratase FabZ [Myxococcales bacterium]|jgi:3-hydroxyacyl-[acyl-carrier-protein] dehydratase